MTLVPPVRSVMSCAAILLAWLITPEATSAQIHIRPQFGVFPISFLFDVPARAPLSPTSTDRDAPLGGGMTGAHFGLHAGLEIFEYEDDIIRVPISVDVNFLRGATTFAVSDVSQTEKQRATFTHTATLFSAGAGIKTSILTYPSLYGALEGRINYLTRSHLHVRQYFFLTDVTTSENDVIPDSSNNLRFGMYAKVGTQVRFFEPFTIDFSAGVGIVNLFGQVTGTKQRNLLIIDNIQHDPEQTLMYFGVGIAVVYKL